MSEPPSPLHFMVPGPLDRRTGGSILDRRIIDGLRALGRAVTVHELAGRFPEPDTAALRAAAAAWQAVPEGGVAVIDGLAGPALVEPVVAESRRGRRLVVFCHHPLALEAGLDAASREALRAAEESFLGLTDRVIVTSPRTRDDLAAYNVPAARIGLVPPGIAPLAPPPAGPRSPPRAPARLLCVGNLIPRKGYPDLLSALALLPPALCGLDCVGDPDLDPDHAAAIRQQAAGPDLAGRVVLHGSLTTVELAAQYTAADLFVLASTHEGYGLVFAEAMQHGLPVVGCAAGAVPDTVPESAGLLVPPGEPAALATAIGRLLADEGLYRRLSAGALAAAAALPDPMDTAARFASEIDRAVAS